MKSYLATGSVIYYCFLIFPPQGLNMITQTQLKSLVTYCPHTGNFTWNGHSSGHNAGDIVGRNARVDKYIVITLNGKAYNLHRLVFLYITGELPPSSLFVDHINGIPSDNRLENLRLCTPQQNAFNSRPTKNDTTGVKGISRIDRPGRLSHYKVRVGVGRDRIQKCFTFTNEDKQMQWERANAFLDSLRLKLHESFSQCSEKKEVGYGLAP